MRDAEVVCEMASIDESYLDVTAAAEHLLRLRGSPAQTQPAHVDEMRIGFQARCRRAVSVALFAHGFINVPLHIRCTRRAAARRLGTRRRSIWTRGRGFSGPRGPGMQGSRRWRGVPSSLQRSGLQCCKSSASQCLQVRPACRLQRWVRVLVHMVCWQHASLLKVRSAA